jgi:hypothetical protein
MLDVGVVVVGGESDHFGVCEAQIAFVFASRLTRQKGAGQGGKLAPN